MDTNQTSEINEARRRFEQNKRELLSWLAQPSSIQVNLSKDTAQQPKIAKSNNKHKNEEESKTPDEPALHKLLPWRGPKRCREENESETSQAKHRSLRSTEVSELASLTRPKTDPSSTQSLIETSH